MLTYETGEPLIKRSIQRRVGKETGVSILETIVKKHKRHIAVGVLCHINDKIILKSVFDLPLEFELLHVHNECDEIAEACKEARKNLLFTGPSMVDLKAMSQTYAAKGTGRRGNWRMYGERPN